MSISEEIKKLITDNLKVDIQIREESTYRPNTTKIKVIVTLDYDGETISESDDYVEIDND